VRIPFVMISKIQVNIMNALFADDILVRINPPKFWAATRLMSPSEQDTLLEAVERLAEAGDLSGLAHFDFITSKRPIPMAA